ncbi:hypothetical protein [Pontiella sulfatireligans]|nr:hypothetical protein [Pontiella sulfatireligans]
MLRTKLLSTALLLAATAALLLAGLRETPLANDRAHRANVTGERCYTLQQ